MDSPRDSELLRDIRSGDDAGPGDDGNGEGAPPSAPGTQPIVGVGVSGQLVFDDPLDRPSSDDTDRGWGDSSLGGGDDDFTRFLNEKPPHHL